MTMRFVRLILWGIAAFGLLPASAGADVQPATVDVRLHVVFLPFTNDVASVDTKTGTAALGVIASQITAQYPLYLACVQTTNAGVGQTGCDATRANVLVTTTFTVPSPATPDAGKVTFGAIDLVDHQQLGVVQVPVALRGTGDDAALTKAMMLTKAQVLALIGTPSIAGGTLTTAAYQQYVQLVPDVGSGQPTYVDLLQNLLARRGIASVASQFNAGTVTSGSVSAQTLCGLGQRYLVYSYAERTEDRILSLNTRVETRMTGHLYDCPTRGDLAFGNDTHTFATNTALSIGPFVNLLAVLFLSKTPSWTYTASAGGLASKILDQTPSQIEPHTVELTMQQFVDSFCDRLPALPTLAAAVPPAPQPFPTPTPSPTPTPTPQPSGHGAPFSLKTLGLPNESTASGASSTTQAATTTSSAAQALDIGQFTAPAPPVLQCGPPIYESPAPIPSNAPLFNRHL
jgi:hypothetical protein